MRWDQEIGMNGEMIRKCRIRSKWIGKYVR
jgi:hypothetical protein